MEQKLKQKLLKNQVNLNFKIMELSEGELLELIRSEQTNKMRSRYISRCYARLSILRKKREKGLMMAGKLSITNIGTVNASTDEMKTLNALLDEQCGKGRTGPMNELYMSYHRARRFREEAQLSKLKF